MQGNSNTPRWQAPTPGVPDRLNRMGLRFFSAPAGGEGGPAAAAPAEGQQQAVSTPTPAEVAAGAAARQQAPAAQQATPQAGQSFSTEYVSELRTEAAEHRVKARDALAANETLTTENATLKAELQALKTEGVLNAAITAAGGNSIAAAAIRGDDVLKGIDPAASDYADKVNAAVAKYVTDHPELKAVQVATSNAAQHAGGSGEKTGAPTSLEAAVAKNYGQ